MLEMYRESLEAAGCFKKEYPTVIKSSMAAISGNVPEKMQALMTATELMLYASHLRKPIMWEGHTIPVNTISFLIGDSGAGKGRSVKSVRNLLKEGYELIDKAREQDAKAKAVEDAEADGKKATDWRKYYSKPRSLIPNVSTLPGMMKHLAALEHGKLGAGFLYVDEVGSELVSNKDLSENIIALAIGYDSGEIPPKLLKDDANQVEPIHNLPFSGLLFGSPANIIYDEPTKKKFKDEFSTKLSRRSFFCFSQDKPEKITFTNIDAARQAARDERERVQKVTEALTPWFTALVGATRQTPLEVETEVEDLFSDYHGYNDWYADSISKQHPMSALHRRHMQWKALKLAGAIAILENEETVTVNHYVQAINFTEMFAEDLENFEVELDKEPYELCSDYMRTTAENGYLNMSIHKLRKMGYIKGNGTPKNKLLELIDLMKTYDDSNKYEYSEGYIHFYEEAEEDMHREELA